MPKLPWTQNCSATGPIPPLGTPSMLAWVQECPVTLPIPPLSQPGGALVILVNDMILDPTETVNPVVWEQLVWGTWDAGQPDRLIVPFGVGLVRISAGTSYVFASDAGQAIHLQVSKNGSFGYVGHTSIFMDTQGGESIVTCCSGPIPVVGGDFFRVSLSDSQISGSQTVLGSGQTWFCMEIVA